MCMLFHILILLQASASVQLEALVPAQPLPDGILLLCKLSDWAGVCNQAAHLQHTHLPLVCSMLPMPESSCWIAGLPRQLFTCVQNVCMYFMYILGYMQPHIVPCTTTYSHVQQCSTTHTKYVHD